MDNGEDAFELTPFTGYKVSFSDISSKINFHYKEPTQLSGT